MKFKLLFILFSFTSYISHAQLKHYLSYNTVVYAEFFIKEKDKSYFPKSFLVPNISYRIERKNIGVEINLNGRYGTNYYPIWSKELVPEQSTLQINATSLSIALHYRLINEKYIYISPHIGVVKNWNERLVLLDWHYHGHFDWYIEKKYGIATGININVPIFKGLYLNINPKYYRFPTAVYNKQNLIFEVGVGYMIQRRKR